MLGFIRTVVMSDDVMMTDAVLMLLGLFRPVGGAFSLLCAVGGSVM